MAFHHIVAAGQSAFIPSSLYRMKADAALPKVLHFVDDPSTREFTHVGSSLFLRSEDQQLLGKWVADKYDRHQHLGKWLGRDILSKRLIGHYDARREYESAQVLKSCGQRVITCHGYGVACNPLNEYGSLYLMEYRPDAVSGKVFFSSLNEVARWQFFGRMMALAIDLADQGYFHTDFHYGNILVEPSDTLVWIDTHVKPLSHVPHHKARQLFNMISPTKLGGGAFAEEARQRLAHHFPEVKSLMQQKKTFS
ncbi:hypothetical protein LMG33818_001113 [Halomonadaceae bacterium LMG 33818]|uniref:hypothetical protein n=1 Tax=Cernens ardua TaxID=3402176 RepID=UPI003EDBA467